MTNTNAALTPNAAPTNQTSGEVLDLSEEFKREKLHNHEKRHNTEEHEIDDQDSAENEPALMNDANILGVEPAGLLEFLNSPASLMVGEMWGQRDRRNTQDEHWNPTAMSWRQWIGGQPGDKNTAAWGFSRHPVGKDKAGACIVLGSSIGKARKAKAMSEMFAMGLDIDSGAKLDDVLTTVEELGLLCLVYTSYNHGKRGLQLKRDEVLRKLQIKRDPSNAEIRQFLREFDKNRYEETFIVECMITEMKKQVKDGVVIELSTPPLEKFRLIFPLAEAVKIIDLAETHEAALALWEDKITGLARNLLGVHFDRSCTDPSRLFFTARHPKDADDWYSAVVMGEPLRFEAVEPMKKSSYTANRRENAFTQAGGGDADDRPPMALSPSGASLNEWHTRFKDRFMLADLMETLRSDKIRVDGGEAQGHVHTECPFEHEHTSEGGTATMAINCLDSQNEYWTWFCHHDACQGRHKLQMLEEALRQEWFDEENLFNIGLGFVLEGADEEEPEEDEDQTKTPEEMAEEFNNSSAQADIEAFICKMLKRGVDLVVQANITTELARNTNLTKTQVKALWKKNVEKQRKRERDRDPEKDGGGASVVIVNQWHFKDQHEYSSRRIHDVNEVDPTLFHYMERLYAVRSDSKGHARMKPVTQGQFEHHLNTVAHFDRVSGDDDRQIGVSAPKDVVTHLFNSDYGEYPHLRGLVTSPTFTADGSLITDPGYDWNSRLYYKPDVTLSVKQVSKAPTVDEVAEAKRLLVKEVLADFPLGGLTRPEIIEQGLYGEGIPALANVMGLILLPFMREMIVGATPGHLILKPTPGTGAGYLTDTCSIISTGSPAPALALPGSRDEMSKTLTSVLANGQNIVFFDNINHSVDSGELASAMTTPIYQARILGKSETVDVDVRCAWIFNGNSVEMAPELIRRITLIDLDANMENPTARSGFRHDDIRGWVTENRGELVWACLTLIQNWVAQGMVHQKDVVLASYENWSGAVGGVLKAAGVGGFMSNREALKAADSGNESPESVLKEFIIGHKPGQRFMTGSNKRSPNAVSIKDSLENFFDGGDPLIFPNGYGYDKHNKSYSDMRALGVGFRRFAASFRADRADGTFTLKFENKGGTGIWTLELTPM